MSEVVPLFFTDNAVELQVKDDEKSAARVVNEKECMNGYEFEEYFQVQTSIDTINRFSFVRVALQLPDSWLWAASRLAKCLQLGARSECKVFVLGDTSYGSCCIDEVNASHLSADFLIHYGHSCLSALKQLIVKSGKKPYVFVVGKLNVPKLANFSEIDIFVVVACPENSLIDSRDYYRPIATPFELNLALRGEDWTGEYITDFGRIFPRLAEAVDLKSTQRHDDEVSDDEGNLYHFSLTTGKITKYANAPTAAPLTSADGGIVPVDNSSKQLSTGINSASDYFTTRTFRGLETKIGETPVTMAVEGLSGIPKNYESENLNK
eukprot:gene2653-3059_t